MANNRRLAQVGSFVGSTSSDKLAFTANTGIGTTNPRFTLEVGAVGASGTTLFVNGDAFVSGALTATSFFGSVTGDITGNADTATALQTARDFSVSGDVTTSSAVSFDGTGNVGLAVTLTETGVAAGSYGASNLIPRITVDSKGRITNVAQNSFAIIQDTSPELGGNLNLNSRNVTGTGNFNVSGVITATTFSGSGASLTNIPNGALENSSVSYGGVELSLGGSDASPAFDLSDATNYPYSSLTGVTTSIVGDTTPQLGGNLDLNSKNVTGTGNFNVTGVITATTFVKSGGTSSQFLKADGTVDSNTYLTAEAQTLDGVLTLGNTSSNGMSVGVTTASSFVKSGGTSSEFLKADGTVDSNTYLTAESDTLDDVTSRGNSTANGISVGVATASSFVKSGGTSSQFLKADGSVDSNTYLTAESQTLDGILTLGNTSALGMSVGVVTASSFIRSGGTSSQFLKADGTVDSSTYLTSALQNVVEDTTPQLGGNLDLNSKNVTGTGSISITGGVSASGVVTATGGFNLGISSAGTSITSGSPVTTLNFVGAGNTFAFNGTTVDISIAGGGGTETETSVSTTAATTIESFAAASYRSARIQVQITQSTDYQVSDILIIHNGSTANIVEYASVATNDYLGTFTATVSGGNVLLQINMGSASSATVKTLTQKIAV